MSMENLRFIIPLLVMGMVLHSTFVCADDPQDKKIYVVYMSSKFHFGSDTVATESLHHELLSSVLGGFEAAQDAKVYSYKSFSGFAAFLSENEATALLKFPEVLSVIESEVVTTQTTQSWDYLQFTTQNPLVMNAGKNVIIGLIDTGIWPESASFSDASMGSIASHWRGICVTADQFNSSNCNKKLIGGRYYLNAYEKFYGPITNDIRSPRDAQGHGTHTSSTAAGAIVKGASMCGLAGGDARGGATAASIAMYKACWGLSQSCAGADILAAFDDAINDNVDIISISLSGLPRNYYDSNTAVGAFHAIMKGITVVASAGNRGDLPSYVTNAAPWFITVAASSTTRKLISQVALGNNAKYSGAAVNTFRLDNFSYPLVNSADIANSSYVGDPSFCLADSLNVSLVKGKIVLCRAYGTIDPQTTVLTAGGAGVVTIDDAGLSYGFSAPIAATSVTPQEGKRISFYIKSRRFATAKIFPSVAVINKSLPPYVGSFSSKGPSITSPGIIKPDIAAPGINILAAWSPLASPSTDHVNDHRSLGYNIITGTSMATPHVAAVAAFVKSLHPDWSPAAIKSAIMTTATVMPVNKKLNPLGVFGSGSGQINPLKAANPGLVFDIVPNDYVTFLCSLNYTLQQIAIFTSANVSCNTSSSVADLNYPSIAVPLLTSNTTVLTIKRTVTNVGSSMSVYKVKVQQPRGVIVTVTPPILAFTALNQERTFTVNFKLVNQTLPPQLYLQGALTWTDGKHRVRVPLAVWQNNDWLSD